MKKILSVLALLLSTGIANTFAGTFNIMNITPCPFQSPGGRGVITDPATGTPYVFSFGPMTINAGSNAFANPTLLPGFSTTAPAGLQTSGCVTSVYLVGPAMPSIFMTNTAPSNTYTSTNNPACNGGNNYTINWNTGGNNCDVVLFIF
ncbi:hypothetical protein [Taibaiella chishuiensis]|uniref:Uncharacterized protein n=1 Tax=Taibaiella chishuiensis TaxID=1434707 RepID=A0A2P8D805_9BACT|nr:hypothetical protein [Taibaiella chishuiensis]PSK93311.1 hypothetical protein B0I18_102281 [Taibaiella chishuiensis]